MATQQTMTHEPLIEQFRYTLPHGTLVLTIAIVPRGDQSPLVYITNETDQLHQRPRCIRASTVPHLHRVHHYERACVDIRDPYRYELELYLIETLPSIVMVRDPEAPRWTVYARLIECREIPAEPHTAQDYHDATNDAEQVSVVHPQ